MKSLISFLHTVLHEMGDWCSVSTSVDVKTINARIEHEGLSFLTITLPSFGKDFERSLDLGYVDHTMFKAFAFHRGLPRFLGGFLDLVFNRVTGRLLDVPSIDAIRAIRQLTLMNAKLGLECSQERKDLAIDKYIECEQSVRNYDLSFVDASFEAFSRIGHMLWAPILSEVDQLVYYGEIVPKHGPGTTADRLLGNKKYRQLEWTERLEEVFPCGEFLLPNWKFYQELDHVDVLEPGAERPVRVVTVPKTLKTPRIIAIEPTCMQYVQQGILEALVNSINRDYQSRELISWSSQLPNQQLARLGSQFGHLATLDLSEASDRVSNLHVKALLQHHPHLAAGVDACRSSKADVPGYGIIPLAKFASMGSALCFPFEAMVFATIIFVGIEQQLNRPLRKADISRLIGQVRVYGDDIVVPVEYAGSVVSALQSYGLLVNASKSFWTGKFRESCGKEYYDGHDVSITRVRSVFPTQRRHASEIVSTVALRNLLFRAGFVTSVDWLDSLIERLIPFPAVGPRSSALGKHVHTGHDTQRMCPDLQRPLVKAFVVKAELPESNLSGPGALMKFFLKRSDLPFADREHYVRAGRPESVDIKLRWTSAL